MDILELIKSRRSVRKFKHLPITDAAVSKILEAGRWAPSGLNNQPWRFMVIKDDLRKNDLAALTSSSSIILDASALVIVCLCHSESYHREKDIMALGACVQNMLLCAHAMDLGGCWLGEILKHKEMLASVLSLPKDLEALAVVALGNPSGELKPVTRKSLDKLTIKI